MSVRGARLTPRSRSLMVPGAEAGPLGERLVREAGGEAQPFQHRTEPWAFVQLIHSSDRHEEGPSRQVVDACAEYTARPFPRSTARRAEAVGSTVRFPCGDRDAAGAR